MADPIQQRAADEFAATSGDVSLVERGKATFDGLCASFNNAPTLGKEFEAIRAVGKNY